ncbi:MAG: MBL fold metallo-hydrolase [Desulfuromonadales bacterium]|nr:MBL fold metallo-hydrolase [Desulfuromonadales bacterium]
MSEKLLLHQLSVGPLQVNCFIAACAETKEAVVIDPGEDADRILELVTKAGYTVNKVINTHGHFDHIGGNRQLVEETGAELLIHAEDVALMQSAAKHAGTYGLSVTPSPGPSKLIAAGDKISVGNLSFEVFHVPGHSPGSVCLLSDGHLFVGDVLFAGSIGRTDLPGGDFEQLITGIRNQLFKLPEETVVHTGHGPDTTIGRELSNNPFVGRAAGK